jgi:hypothetical protein
MDKMTLAFVACIAAILVFVFCIDLYISTLNLAW